uniref:Uncharacterized protein n=1 Tax=Clandestinovirus TaxID=2831644 RepID=A0A8F8PMA7_9VIRU|nr:hypothetical protein KOM_12_80 [Clandestinovirus]
MTLPTELIAKINIKVEPDVTLYSGVASEFDIGRDLIYAKIDPGTKQLLYLVIVEYWRHAAAKFTASAYYCHPSVTKVSLPQPKDIGYCKTNEEINAKMQVFDPTLYLLEDSGGCTGRLLNDLPKHYFDKLFEAKNITRIKIIDRLPDFFKMFPSVTVQVTKSPNKPW